MVINAEFFLSPYAGTMTELILRILCLILNVFASIFHRAACVVHGVIDRFSGFLCWPFVVIASHNAKCHQAQ